MKTPLEEALNYAHRKYYKQNASNSEIYSSAQEDTVFSSRFEFYFSPIS